MALVDTETAMGAASTGASLAPLAAMGPVGWAAIGLSVAGSIMSGRANSKARKEQAAAEEELSRQQREAAKVRAMKLRQAVGATKSSAQAALAASGVDLGSDLSNIVSTDIQQRSDADIYYTLMQGEQRGMQLDTQASIYRDSAKSEMTAGYMGAASSALSIYGSSAFRR